MAGGQLGGQALHLLLTACAGCKAQCAPDSTPETLITETPITHPFYRCGPLLRVAAQQLPPTSSWPPAPPSTPREWRRRPGEWCRQSWMLQPGGAG